jgi:Cu+-exporting ATPase
MFTGDGRRTARPWLRNSASHVEAEVLPEREDQEVVKSARKGDGGCHGRRRRQRCPSTAAADGIAMGTGTDVAMQSAGVTLVKGDLRGIVRARHLSRATMRNIRQNLFFAFVYNALGVPIAAGALYPWTGLLLSPIIASAAMTFSSVSVIANALRLRRGQV